MDDITKGLHFKVDLDRPVITRPQRGHLTYGDDEADRIMVEVYRGTTPVMLSGVDAGAVFYAPPDRAEINLLNTAISGNTVSVLLDEHCYAEEGYYEMEIYLRANGRKVTILSISGDIHRAGSGIVIDVDSAIPSIDDLLDMISDINEVKNAALAAAEEAKTAAENLTHVTATARTIGHESTAYVSVQNMGTYFRFEFGIPRGEPGTIQNVTISSIAGLSSQLNEKLSKSEALEKFYPVGSIYLSTSDADPATLMGGVWHRIEGVFLLAADAAHGAGTRGGSETVSLTAAQNGPHTHSLKITKESLAGGSTYSRLDTSSDTPSSSLIGESGAGEPHENMPPYLAVYMWTRVE